MGDLYLQMPSLMYAPLKHECSQAYEHQYASPLQKPYLAWSNKDSIVLRLRLTVLSEFGGEFSPLILNRIPLLQELELELIQTQMAQKPMLRAEVRGQTHSTDRMLSPIEELRTPAN